MIDKGNTSLSRAFIAATAPFSTLEDSVVDYVRNHLMQANPYY